MRTRGLIVMHWLQLTNAGRLIVGVVAILTVLAPLPAAQASHIQASHMAKLPLPGQIQLTPSLSSPQPLGTPITWSATATDTAPLVYRFSVATAAAGPYRVVRDFSTRPSFVWAPLQEGAYFIAVTIQEGYSGTATVSTFRPYTLTSRVNGTQAVVSPTANPLVALYSAPACAAGDTMAVRFRLQGAQRWTYTGAQTCQSGMSRNFLVAGMRATATYQLEHVVIHGSTISPSPPLSFTTGALPSSLVFPTFGVPQPPGPRSDTAQSLIYHDLAGPVAHEVNPLVTDIQGQVVWYNHQPDLMDQDGVRIQWVGGQISDRVILFAADSAQINAQGDKNVLRVIDLAGDPLEETNVQILNRQLVDQGHEIVYSFSHDALILPNGDIALLAHTQQTITSTAIMGDMLMVLNQDLQLVWAWDAFQHLNPYRGPTLGDTCGDAYRTCPVPGGPGTIDWTHANSIDYSPSDGNLIVSLRAQDWVIKINYANGQGDGRVLWRLGPQGDFTIKPLSATDPYPWFSHQHDANFVDGTNLAIFDNGNTRCASVPPPCHSRGQSYTIDEQTRVATQRVNADLGVYSDALGVAQRLTDGNYNFSAGVDTLPPPPHGQEIEVLPGGAKVYVQQIDELEYRAWRLSNLYSPTNQQCPSCAYTS